MQSRTSGVSYDNAGEKIICDDYTNIQKPVDNSFYISLDPSCTIANTANCEEVTRIEYTGSNCKALCQEDEEGKAINCQEVCTSYVAEEIVSYHGGDCVIDSGCAEFFQDERISYIAPGSVTSCQSFGTCNQFGCSVELTEPYRPTSAYDNTPDLSYLNGNCDESIGCLLEDDREIYGCGPYGCPVSPVYFELNRVCEEEFYCTDMDCDGPADDITDPNLDCIISTVPNGNPLIINVTERTTNELHNTYYQCISEPSIEDGDPVCEFLPGEEVRYNVLREQCELKGEDVCDSGMIISGDIASSTTSRGCNNITANANDYWGNYNANSNCVEESASISNVYTQACCYAYSIDNFAIYDNELSNDNVQNGIRVY